jgi:hypothetical protein
MVVGAAQVDGPDRPFVRSAEEMAGKFSAELIGQMPLWKARLVAEPEGLPQLEQDVHAAFARGADLVVTGLLAMVMGREDFLAAAEQTRCEFATPLRPGRERKIQVRLLGGLLIWLTSLYCAPRRRASDLSEDEEASSPPGLYVELAQFGFGKGCSPALESRVARQAALHTSYQNAADELARDGIDLDVKTVRRITTQCGERGLALRSHELDLFRAGQLPAGTELAGKHVGVQFDGGRTRLRGPLRAVPPRPSASVADGLPTEDAPGRSRARPRRTFDAEWREPKLFTIFVHDEQGRMDDQVLATVEGTFEGPDALAELIAMTLHRLGAAQAHSVTFAGDGATWIWDRVPTIVARAGLTPERVHEVLDNCHAAHHISQALAALGLNDRDRLPLYRELRTKLRNGHWREVTATLTELAAEHPANEAIRTEVAYLTKHGEAGRLKYPEFRRQGVPLGSGAIESSIRRVINLRLKGNGIFWDQAHAEAMLHVRALIISKRWDERLAAIRALERRQGRQDWRRDPRPMSIKADPTPTTPQPT